MKKVIKLTEDDLTRIVKRVIEEQVGSYAAKGAAMGSIVPGAGTVIGGVVGALVGTFEKIMGGGGNASSKVKQIISTCANSKAPVTSQTNKIADMVYDAISGIGTDENKVYRAMAMPKGVDEFCGVVKSYKSSYKEDLYSALDGDFDSEGEWVMIMRPLRDMVLRSKQRAQAKQQVPVKSTKSTPKPTMGSGSTRPTR